MFHVSSPSTTRYLVAPTERVVGANPTGLVCRGAGRSQHRAGGVVTSSKLMLELLLLLLLSSSPSPCRG